MNENLTNDNDNLRELNHLESYFACKLKVGRNASNSIETSFQARTDCTSHCAKQGNWFRFIEAETKYVPSLFDITGEHLLELERSTTPSPLRCTQALEHLQLTPVRDETLAAIPTSLSGNQRSKIRTPTTLFPTCKSNETLTKSRLMQPSIANIVSNNVMSFVNILAGKTVPIAGIFKPDKAFCPLKRNRMWIVKE